MKIIEALKQLKYLNRKLSDLQTKVHEHCADMDCEKAVYTDQKDQVKKWVQMYCDTVKEMGRLKNCIHKTNISTNVPIEIGGRYVEKTIDEWITRRRELVQLESTIWKSLTDRNLPAQQAVKNPTTGEHFITNIRRYYDPVQRDEKLNILREEPTLIDSALEIVNAVTDLLE